MHALSTIGYIIFDLLHILIVLANIYYYIKGYMDVTLATNENQIWDLEIQVEYIWSYHMNKPTGNDQCVA